MLVLMLLALGALPNSVASSVAETVEQQPTGSVLPIFVDYDAPPPQLSQLCGAADAIVVVKIQAIRFDSPIDPVVGRRRDVTQYEVRVLEALKPHSMVPPPQGTFVLTRQGGQHVENGRIIRSAVRGFEEFIENSEYVLFLTWNNRTHGFDIAYGPHGSYQLLPSGTVRPLGAADVAIKQQNKGTAEFIQELRNAVAR